MFWKKTAKKIVEAAHTERAEPPVILKYDFSFSLDMTTSGFFVYKFSMTSPFWITLNGKAEYDLLEMYCAAKEYRCEIGEIYADGECVVPPILQIHVPYSDSSEFESSAEFQNFLSCLKAIKKQDDIVVSQELRASEVSAHYKRIVDILADECDGHNEILQTGASSQNNTDH